MNSIGARNEGKMMGYFAKYLVGLFCLAILAGPLAAKVDLDRGFLFGKVTMKNGDTYTGMLRWGKEEAFWGDMFNTTKIENETSDYMSRSDLRKVRKNQNFGQRVSGFFNRLFGKRRYRNDLVKHQFICRFGDIRKLTMRRGKRVTLELKNKDIVEVKGGSNDIGTKIHVLDKKAGKISVRWDRIRSIEFLSTPEDFGVSFGSPLFGTVKTHSGSFKGFIQWDHEECLSTDLLNGETSNETDIDIEFGDISEIRKYGRGSKVTLHSGKSHYVYGTNDVNDDNRGIVINDINLGKVLVEWDEFISVRFERSPEVLIPNYEDYPENRVLTGTIRTRGNEILSGRLIFDLDETTDIEMLEGIGDGISYYIPFRNISKIVPRGDYSRVFLKNGEKLELEDGRDVSNDNDGVLIWHDGKKKPVYVPWRKVRELQFN